MNDDVANDKKIERDETDDELIGDEIEFIEKPERKDIEKKLE